ncbi:hypothetical protein RJ55_02687 [Drechmeria coniospora]|nr:hypothetical protein RJ55_02687 [Drechmeria coniospora]
MHTFLGTALLAVFGTVQAQFVQPKDPRARNLTVKHSPGDVTISFKEPHGVCKTALPTQKQYSGWVDIPGDYPTNLFFYYVGARNSTDTLTVWFTGGPGASSMYEFFVANGPCEVVERGLNEYETVAREWGWDRASNMLFIDQPNQVGFSYDTPTDGTLAMLNGSVIIPPVSDPDAIPAWGLLNGTFSSGNPKNTVNNTQSAAYAAWHVIQRFYNDVPLDSPRSNASFGVNLFTSSYGGVYGPIFAETWEAQNKERNRLNGNIDPDSTVDLHIKSLGIVNGCIDLVTEEPQYIHFATNNTYGVHPFSSNETQSFLDKIEAADGCKALATRYDVAAPEYGAFPPVQFVDYLNQGNILDEIESPVNFTLANDMVFNQFRATGDGARGETISATGLEARQFR